MKHSFICATDQNTFGKNSDLHYKELLDRGKAGELDDDEIEECLDNLPLELYCEILKNLVDHQVVVVVLPYSEKKMNIFDQGLESAESLKKLVTSLQGIDVFFDDFQVAMN